MKHIRQRMMVMNCSFQQIKAIEQMATKQDWDYAEIDAVIDCIEVQSNYEHSNSEPWETLLRGDWSDKAEVRPFTPMTS